MRVKQAVGVRDTLKFSRPTTLVAVQQRLIFTQRFANYKQIYKRKRCFSNFHLC